MEGLSDEDVWKYCLRKYLCLGTFEGLLISNNTSIDLEKCIDSLIVEGCGCEVVEMLQNFRSENRTPKRDAILFALATCCRCCHLETKKKAYNALPDICQNPADLFQFLSFYRSLGVGSGWGRAHRRAVAKWYLGYEKQDGQKKTKEEDEMKKMVYHFFKYQSRHGWSHKDVFRLCHFKKEKLDEKVMVKYMVLVFTSPKNGRERGKEWLNEVKKSTPEDKHRKFDELENLVEWYIKAQKCKSMNVIIDLIDTYDIPREVVPSEMLNYKTVWKALLRRMPFTALIRNLGKMSNLDVFERGSFEENLTIQKLTNPENIQRSKVHPFTLLVALTQYRKGRGELGSLTWAVNPYISQALEDAFYLSFKSISTVKEKSYLIAVDLNGAMNAPVIGSPTVSALDAAAALTMATVRCGDKCSVVAFSSKEGTPLQGVDLGETDSLSDVLEKFAVISPGKVDCSLLLTEATKAKNGKSSILPKTDVFIVYTGFKTDFSKDAAKLLHEYDKNSRFVLCSLSNSLFQTSLNPKLLEIAGFDSHTPNIINEFVRGSFEC